METIPFVSHSHWTALTDIGKHTKDSAQFPPGLTPAVLMGVRR